MRIRVPPSFCSFRTIPFDIQLGTADIYKKGKLKMGLIDKLFGTSGMTKVERLRAKKRVGRLWRMARRVAPVGSAASRRSYQARAALIEIGEPAVPVLIKALKKRDAVKKATEILCSMEERAVDPLVRLLTDKDEQTQSLAKGVLKSMHNAKAGLAVMRAEGGVEALLKALKLGPAEARIDAAKLLAKTGDERAIDALIGALNEPGHDRGTRWILTKALLDIGDARAIEALERSLRQLSLLGILHPSYWQYVRTGAIHPTLREEINRNLRAIKFEGELSQGAVVADEGGGSWVINEGGLGIFRMKPGSEVNEETGGGQRSIENKLDLWLTNSYPPFQPIHDAIHRIRRRV